MSACFLWFLLSHAYFLWLQSLGVRLCLWFLKSPNLHYIHLCWLQTMSVHLQLWFQSPGVHHQWFL